MLTPSEGSIVVLSTVAFSGVWIILTLLWPRMEAGRLRARILELTGEGLDEDLYQQAMRYSGELCVTRIALGRFFRAPGQGGRRLEDHIPPVEIRLRRILSRHVFTGSPSGWLLLMFAVLVWLIHGRRGPFWEAADQMLPGSPDPYELLWPEGRPADLR